MRARFRLYRMHGFSTVAAACLALPYAVKVSREIDETVAALLSVKARVQAKAAKPALLRKVAL